MKKQPTIEELVLIAEKDGNDADLVILDRVVELESEVESLKETFKETVTTIKSEVPDLNKILDVIKGQPGEPGYTPVKGVDYNDGKPGTNYVLTDEDKQEIAQSVVIPTVELDRIIEKTEIIREQPIVTEKIINEIKEVAVTDTPDVIVSKVNTSSLLIKKERVEGLLDLVSNVAHSAVASMPVTTSFFNGLRAKNLNIIGATATQSGDTVNVTVASGTGPGGSVTLADVSANSTTTQNSLYTMTSTIPVEFKRSGGQRLLYLDETNGRVGVGPTAPTEDFMVSTTTGPVAVRIKSGDSTAGLLLDGGGTIGAWGLYATSVGGVTSLGIYDLDAGAYRWAVDSSGHFVAGTDNTYDLGKSAALRPRTGYFGTSVVTPAGSFSTNVDIGSAGYLQWTAGRTLLRAPGTGQLTLDSGAETAGVLLDFATAGTLKLRTKANADTAILASNQFQATGTILAATTGGVTYTGYQIQNGTTTGRFEIQASDDSLNVGSTSNHIFWFKQNDTKRWGISTSGNFLANTDGVYDIGASGATRPRTIYVQNTVNVDATLNKGYYWGNTGIGFRGTSNIGLYNGGNLKVEFDYSSANTLQLLGSSETDNATFKVNQLTATTTVDVAGSKVVINASGVDGSGSTGSFYSTGTGFFEFNNNFRIAGLGAGIAKFVRSDGTTGVGLNVATTGTIWFKASDGTTDSAIVKANQLTATSTVNVNTIPLTDAGSVLRILSSSGINVGLGNISSGYPGINFSGTSGTMWARIGSTAATLLRFATAADTTGFNIDIDATADTMTIRNLADNAAGGISVGALTATGTTTLATSLTGILRADSGVVSVDSTLTNTTANTYTPTLTGVANVGASTAYVCQYMRVGSVVTVSGQVDIDPTLGVSTTTQLGISLPVASNFANANEAGGTCCSPSIASQSGGIYADATNDRVTLDFKAADPNNTSWWFTFTYRII